MPEFSSDAKSILNQLKGDARFKSVMRDLKQNFRPVVPAYAPQATRDSEAQLVEQIKFETARRLGFDLLYRALTGESNE